MAGSSVSTGIVRQGRLSKTISSTSVTLTEAEQKHGILEFTGSPGGAVTITIASVMDGAVWLVNNQCGQQITLKASGGTGAVVANGKVAVCYCTDTDVVAGPST